MPKKPIREKEKAQGSSSELEDYWSMAEDKHCVMLNVA